MKSSLTSQLLVGAAFVTLAATFVTVLHNRRSSGTLVVPTLPQQWNSADLSRCLSSGLDPNSTIGGQTLLSIAIARNDENAARVLVEAGANLFQNEPDGKTPLQLAAETRGAILNVMLDTARDIDLNHAFDNGGLLPLHRAIAARNSSGVATLLSHGADPHALGKAFKISSLTFAISEGYEGAVDLLVADTQLTDEGRSRLQVALSYSESERDQNSADAHRKRIVEIIERKLNEGDAGPH